MVQSGCWSACCVAQIAASRTGDKEERFPPLKSTFWKLHIRLPFTYGSPGRSDGPHPAAGETGRRGSGHSGGLRVQRNVGALLLRKRGDNGPGAQSTVGHAFSCQESRALAPAGRPLPPLPLSAPARGLLAGPPAPSPLPPGRSADCPLAWPAPPQMFQSCPLAPCRSVPPKWPPGDTSLHTPPPGVMAVTTCLCTPLYPAPSFR